MTNRAHEDLLTLSTANRWLKCLEEDEAEDLIDRSLRRSLRAYITELKYRAGIVIPYKSHLDRRDALKESLHGLDPVYDHLAELAGDPEMRHAQTAALLFFLCSMVTDLGGVIYAIEAQYPQWADAFALERKMYADWLEGKGPLADGPWHPEERDILG